MKTSTLLIIFHFSLTLVSMIFPQQLSLSHIPQLNDLINRICICIYLFSSLVKPLFNNQEQIPLSRPLHQPSPRWKTDSSLRWGKCCSAIGLDPWWGIGGPAPGCFAQCPTVQNGVEGKIKKVESENKLSLENEPPTSKFHPPTFEPSFDPGRHIQRV